MIEKPKEKARLTYDLAIGLLQETYSGQRLADALVELEYINDLALEISAGEDLEPVWSMEEVLALGAED